MTGVVLQIAATTIAGSYLVYYRTCISRRKSRSWESLVARLRPYRFLGEERLPFPPENELNSHPEETWNRMEDLRGLWIIHKNASVMLEMADYAAQNSDNPDQLLLQTLRCDAVQIRISVARAVVLFACCCAREGVRANAFRAVSIYTDMALRMTQLLQQGAIGTLPDFMVAS